MTVAKKLFSVAAAVVSVCACLAFGLRSGAEPPALPRPGAPVPVPADKGAQKPPAVVIGKGFAIAPVTTDLQRQLLRGAGPDSTALLVVDGPAMFKDATTLDVEALDPTGLRKGLKAFQPAKGKSVVQVEVHYSNIKEPAGAAREVLDYALHGAARAEGFVPGTPVGFHTYANGAFAFDRHVAPLKDDTGAGEAEAGVGDGRARAYPVRTPLSRMLTESVAGVVFVLPALDCRADAWVPADVDASVKAALGKLKLAKGERVNFRLNIPQRDERVQDRVRAACNGWAADAGLEVWSFSY